MEALQLYVNGSDMHPLTSLTIDQHNKDNTLKLTQILVSLCFLLQVSDA